MTFIQSLLQDPKSIHNYPTKKVDALTHDFASEKLEDRIHSLYSWLAEGNEVTHKIRFKLSQFKSELAFLKAVNNASDPLGKNKSIKPIQKLWNQLVIEVRQQKLETVTQ